jgi:hypothetical protein
MAIYINSIESQGLKRPSAAKDNDADFKRFRSLDPDFYQQTSCLCPPLGADLASMPYEILWHIFDQLEAAYVPSTSLQMRAVSNKLNAFIVSIPNLKIYVIGYSALKQAYARGAYSSYSSYFLTRKIGHCNSEYCEGMQEKVTYCGPSHPQFYKLLAAYDLKKVCTLAKGADRDCLIADTLHYYHTDERRQVFKMLNQADGKADLFNYVEKYSKSLKLTSVMVVAEDPSEGLKELQNSSCPNSFKLFAHGYEIFLKNYPATLDQVAADVTKIIALCEPIFHEDLVGIYTHMCMALGSAGYPVGDLASVLINSMLLYGADSDSLQVLMTYSREFFQSNNETEEVYAFEVKEFLMGMIINQDPKIQFDVLSWLWLQFPKSRTDIKDQLYENFDRSLALNAWVGQLIPVVKACSKIDLQHALKALAPLTCTFSKLKILLSIDAALLNAHRQDVLLFMEEIGCEILKIASGRESPKLKEILLEDYVALMASMGQMEVINQLLSAATLANQEGSNPMDLQKRALAIMKGVRHHPCKNISDECLKIMRSHNIKLTKLYKLDRMMSGLKSTHAPLFTELMEQIFRETIDTFDKSFDKEKYERLYWIAEKCLFDEGAEAFRFRRLQEI